VVLARISRWHKDGFKVEVVAYTYLEAITEHYVKRVVVDGAELEIGEGDRVYIEAVMIRVAGGTAEITTPAKILKP